jgi:glycosyltransferase involved in cell wall biosynthesis
MSWLYQNCLMTVYPSLYEGWGLPIGESLHFGKLCLASDTSSMPEIAGGLIDYFSPYNADQLVDKITHYSNNKYELIAKEKAIKMSYKSNTWQQAYKQID